MHSAVASQRQGKVKSKLETMSTMWLELRINLRSLMQVLEPGGIGDHKGLACSKWKVLLGDAGCEPWVSHESKVHLNLFLINTNLG